MITAKTGPDKRDFRLSLQRVTQPIKIINNILRFFDFFCFGELMFVQRTFCFVKGLLYTSVVIDDREQDCMDIIKVI